MDYVQIVSKKNQLLMEKALFGDKAATAELREMGLLYWEHRGRIVLDKGHEGEATVTWEEAVLKSTIWLGDGAYMEEIYETVGDFRKLTRKDFRVGKDREERFKPVVRSTVYHLVRVGLVRRLSRGLFAPTEEGHAALHAGGPVKSKMLMKALKEKGLTVTHSPRRSSGAHLRSRR